MLYSDSFESPFKIFHFTVRLDVDADGLVQAKNVVLNVSEIEAKVREATNDDPWYVSVNS
jgi:hypothetical protein